MPRVVTAGRANANPARLHRRIRIERNRILIHRDASLAERFLRLAAQHALGEYIDQHEVRVRSAGDDAIPVGRERLGHHLGIGHDLPRIVAEARLRCLQEAHRFRRDDVHQRPSLHSRKDDLVDFFRKFRLCSESSPSAARAASCAWSKSQSARAAPAMDALRPPPVPRSAPCRPDRARQLCPRSAACARNR